MSKFFRFIWEAEYGGIGTPRKLRQPCSYEAYIPDRLIGRQFRLESSLIADITDAERAISVFNERAKALVDTEALARLLLRAESVASSRIEGLVVGARRLLAADAAAQLGEKITDVTAAGVLANVSAMSYAINSVQDKSRITVKQLLQVHKLLLEPTRFSSVAGLIRTEQNWLGGNAFNPCGAEFVPPPPEYVLPLLEDLCAFCNDTSLPALVQAAIAHAQFETIHPFVDGNGRVGRALIHMIMRARLLTPRVQPPVSLVLATWAEQYVSALQATRYRGATTSASAIESINEWIGLFVSACRRSIADVSTFEAQLQSLERQWLQRLPLSRADATVIVLLRKLSAAPILTVQTAMNLTGRTFPAVNNAIAQLVDAGILIARNDARRNRTFEASEIILAFTNLERKLASATGDTRQRPPSRSVSYRRGKPTTMSSSSE